MTEKIPFYRIDEREFFLNTGELCQNEEVEKSVCVNRAVGDIVRKYGGDNGIGRL